MWGGGLTVPYLDVMQFNELNQNEGMRSILGCTKDTSAEAVRYMLDLPPMDDRHKLAQVKDYTRVAADTSNPLHDTIGVSLQRGSKEELSGSHKHLKPLKAACRLTQSGKGRHGLHFKSTRRGLQR